MFLWQLELSIRKRHQAEKASETIREILNFEDFGRM